MDSSGNSEAIRLAQASDWKGLQRLLERDPVMAKQRGDHDMLPIHWVCTVRRVPLSLIAKLLQAYPDGVRTKNAGDLLPLHIAIRARVQASCLRKLVRAYPDAVNERTPDGLSALEMAEEIGLDAGSLKVLHRAQERRCVVQQQDDEDSAYDRESVELNPKRLLSGQEEGEASGVERPEEDEDKATKEWTDAAVPEPYVGNVGFGGFLHVGDDGELNTTEMSALEPDYSISMMSEQSLSDIDDLDSPHDHLVSPSSTSTCSQNDPRSPTSSRSSFGRIRTGSRRGFGGFQNLNPETSRQHTRMHRTASLLVQLQNTGILSERELRTMVSAMSASAAVGNTEDEGSSRSHNRHMSLPLMPSYENLRQKSNFHFYDEDDENENDNGSSRDSTSTAGGASGNLMNSRGRLFQSVQEPFQSRHSVTPGGSQRGSPPLFRRRHRRASHGSHSRGHFDPPPEWKHDGECSICRASFGMFKHRHHCRNCGKSICSQHSADKKISMEAKGFTTPQRVCVTCYAMITHSRTLKHDLELEEMGRDGSMLNPVAFQQQHYAVSVGANDRHTSAVASFPSATTPGPSRTAAFGSSRSPATSAGGSPTTSPTTGQRFASRKSSVLAAGEATGGAGERATTSNHASGLSGASSSPVHELRGLLASQQKQIEQLAQSNMQMQQQLLEQEELKAETMLLITQLMTRVSVLELQKDHTVSNSKRRSIGTGDSEDEEFPQDDITSFER